MTMEENDYGISYASRTLGYKSISFKSHNDIINSPKPVDVDKGKKDRSFRHGNKSFEWDYVLDKWHDVLLRAHISVQIEMPSRSESHFHKHLE